MTSGKGPLALAAEAKRKEAEAAALRANLKRRKAQLRGRQAVEDDAAIDAVLRFWFGADRTGFRPAWFEKNDAFDADCQTRFAAAHEAAAAGTLARWADTPEGGLALVILLDQIPRNIFRGTPRAFATDAAALRLAERLVARGFDRTLEAAERLFVYLPYEHAEDLATQETAVALVESLPETPWRQRAVESARAHRDLIARFGRFPHRNAVLGRAGTPEEVAYLATPGAGF